MLDVANLYQPYHQLQQSHFLSRPVASLAVISFGPCLQVSQVYFYFTLCDCPDGQSI